MPMTPDDQRRKIAELEGLLPKVKRWHTDECKYHKWIDDGDCTCGYVAARERCESLLAASAPWLLDLAKRGLEADKQPAIDPPWLRERIKLEVNTAKIAQGVALSESQSQLSRESIGLSAEQREHLENVADPKWAGGMLPQKTAAAALAAIDRLKCERDSAVDVANNIIAGLRVELTAARAERDAALGLAIKAAAELARCSNLMDVGADAAKTMCERAKEFRDAIAAAGGEGT